MGIIYDILDKILPFSWAAPIFMKKALLAVLIITPMCACLGIHVVNFRMSFFSDTISHSAFTGIALGLLLNIDPKIAMIGFGLLVGLSIVKLKSVSTLSLDTVIGVFFSMVIAFGIVVISAKKGLTNNLQSFLYGDILTLTNKDIVVMLSLFVIILIYSVARYNDNILISVNKDLAKSQGLNVKIMEYIFAALVALVVTVSISSVGLLLVTALLIVPAAIGRNISKTAKNMFWTTIIVAIISAISGLAASYYWESSSGATIVLIACTIFMVTQIKQMIC